MEVDGKKTVKTEVIKEGKLEEQIYGGDDGWRGERDKAGIDIYTPPLYIPTALLHTFMPYPACSQYIWI